MHKRNSTATVNVFQMVLDSIFIGIAYMLASMIYIGIREDNVVLYHIWMLLLLIMIFVPAMFLYRMYDVTTFNYADRIIIRTFISVFIAGLCISAAIFLLKLDATSRLMFLFFCGLSYVLVVAERFAVRIIYHAGLFKPAARVMFIGDTDVFKEYVRFTRKTALTHQFVEALDFSNNVMKSTDSFELHIIKNQIDEVVLVYNGKCKFDYESYMKVCEDMGITVRLALDFINLEVSHKYISSIGTYPVVTYHSVSLEKIPLCIKQVIDYIIAGVGLILSSPLFLLAAIAIKLESPGPVFFRQERVGLNGKVFKIYKFRSMYIDAEERKKELAAYNKMSNGLMFKMDNDPRITKVGSFIRKTSIDELPQFINVIKGDMSMVGTRPPTRDEVEKYDRKHRRRISIKPGITGMWQVNGRSDVLDFEKVVELDCNYIKNWSLLLDFKLMLQTVVVVFFRKGAA